MEKGNSDHEAELPSRGELEQVAAVLDEAARTRGHYSLAMRVRELLGLGALQDADDDTPLANRALLCAIEYHIEVQEVGGQRRIRLAPGQEFTDGSTPPAVNDVADDVVDVWRALILLVRESPSSARLHHLLFERGGADRALHARTAATAYIDSAERWTRDLDAVDDLSAAIRLSRAVGDNDTVTKALQRVLRIAEEQLARDEPAAGVVGRALRLAIGEPGCPDAVDGLIERAVKAWPGINQRDSAYALLLMRARTVEDRRSVWELRIQAWLDAADNESLKLLRSMRLQQAMRLAEQSGDGELRRLAASRLQTVRNEDLEMLCFSASSRRYQEEFDRLVELYSAGITWKEALGSFATMPPLSGDVESNRRIIRDRQAANFLGSLFPTLLLGADGLPMYEGTSEEDRFDVELVRWECELISNWGQVTSAALHRVVEIHGLPAEQDLAAFLNLPIREPDGRVGPALARSLYRYWSGDSEGAAYTVLPRVEGIVRDLVLSSDSGIGIYRLQREQIPGQYAGLGYLLPLLGSELGVDESHIRYLSAVLRHPAGFNLRNQLLHGFSYGAPGPDTAAILIHVALSLVAILHQNAFRDGSTEERE
ncbi:DUF4209 domain-containing protein [Spongisporangium articulatum]|uniref:DUF4209 domain-containing protein n=1 Tax=Spongisporangium articulatum TaxID=3362603 RepID=A0ABW8AKZ5_9ACTN